MFTERVKRILAIFFLILILLVFVGVSDYLLRGMSLYDSLIGSTSRVLGAGEGVDLGKSMLSLVLTFVLASAVYYLVSYLIDSFLGINFTEVFMMNKILRMKNHYIICGAGRVGYNAAKKLQELKESFVIIEMNPDVAGEMRNRMDYDVIVGDCTDEYVLKKANVEKAKGVICALGNNEENFYVLITAKHLNPNIKVAARADSEDIGKKMTAVGADLIVTPEVVGGRKLATGLSEI